MNTVLNKIKPNLFIPGAPKSGTSSLHKLLEKHKEIYGGIEKEPHTYNIQQKYKLRFIKMYKHSFYNFYHKSNDAKFILDSSTTYLVSSKALERIKKDTPDAKFIVLGRDPFDRIRSHYRWLCSLGFVEKEFNEEVMNESKKRFNPKINYWGNYKNYISFSEYGKQLEILLSLFPEQNILFVKYENLVCNNKEELEKIWNFLDIESLDILLPKYNKTKKIIKPKVRSRSLINSYSIKRIIKQLLLVKQSPNIKMPIKSVPDVADEELEFIYDFLKNDIHKFIDMGYNLDDWHIASKIMKSRNKSI